MTAEGKHVRTWARGAIIALALTSGLLTCAAPASAHRTISAGSALSRANSAIKHHAWSDGRSPNSCTSENYQCVNLSVPLVYCGIHSYCWSGSSFTTVRCVIYWCWSYHRWSSNGTVNGHTGKVSIYRRW